MWRWLGPIPAACILFTVVGTINSFGVYVALLDRPAVTSSTGWSLLASYVGWTITGVILHDAQSDEEYRRKPRAFATVCGLLMMTQVVMAYSISVGANALIKLCAILYGFAYGGLYLISLTMVQAWVPEHLGCITALGTMFMPLGSTVGTAWFQAVANALKDPIAAMAFTGIVNALIILFASQFIDLPPRGWHPHDIDALSEKKELLSKSSSYGCTQEPDVEAQCEVESGNGKPLTPLEMMQSPAFYLIMIAYCAVCVPGSGVAMGFPSMLSLSFGIPVTIGNNWVMWVLLPGVFARLSSGLAVDCLIRRKRGLNVLPSMLLLVNTILSLQLLAIALMPLFIRLGLPIPFTILCCVVMFVFSSCDVALSCLVRFMFTPLNSSLAFSSLGTTAGILMLAEMVIISEHTVGNISKSIDAPVVHPQALNTFFMFIGLIALAGAISSFYLDIDRRAYNKAKVVIPPQIMRFGLISTLKSIVNYR